MAMIPSEVVSAIRTVENPIIFELGVCNGVESHEILAAARGKARYFAFEPHPTNVLKCLDSLPKEINFYPFAVCDTTGPVKFFVSHPDQNGLSASSSVSPFKNQSKHFPWCVCVGEINVSGWRLDDFVKIVKVDHIDFIWMDVQGAERLVFSGAKEILQKTRYIYTEIEGKHIKNEGDCYQHSSSLERLLNEYLLGWEVVHDFSTDVLLKNPNYA
jgi:FkbM family methyltransferase